MSHGTVDCEAVFAYSLAAHNPVMRTSGGKAALPAPPSDILSIILSMSLFNHPFLLFQLETWDRPSGVLFSCVSSAGRQRSILLTHYKDYLRKQSLQ